MHAGIMPGKEDNWNPFGKDAGRERFFTLGPRFSGRGFVQWSGLQGAEK